VRHPGANATIGYATLQALRAMAGAAESITSCSWPWQWNWSAYGHSASQYRLNKIGDYCVLAGQVGIASTTSRLQPTRRYRRQSGVGKNVKQEDLILGLYRLRLQAGTSALNVFFVAPN
jgi:hypothetical protein